MAFFIPVETIHFVLSQYEKYGKVMRPEIGTSFDESWEARIGLPTQKGITVRSTTSSELKAGDMVVAINGVPIHNLTDYSRAIRDTFVDVLRMTVLRDGETMELQVSYTLQ